MSSWNTGYLLVSAKHPLALKIREKLRILLSEVCFLSWLLLVFSFFVSLPFLCYGFRFQFRFFDVEFFILSYDIDEWLKTFAR